MTALAHAIIGSSFVSSPGNVIPVGKFSWNGTLSNYSYASGTVGNITSLSYNFPDNTTTSTTHYNANAYQSTYSLGSVSNFWIDFWVYPTSFGEAILTEMDNNTGPGYYYNMLEIDNDGHIYAGTWNGGNISHVVSADKVTLNAWNHIFFYYYDGVLHLEVNGGTPVETGGVTRSGPGNTFLAVGFHSVTAMFTANQFQGYIETIYASSTSVASRYNSTKSKYQAQPVLALRAADYTSNGTWTDAIAGKRFTMYNDPTWSDTNGGQIRFHAANSEYADSSTSLSSLTSYTLQGVFQVQTSIQSLAQCVITEKFWEGISKINYALGYINGGGTQIDAGFFNLNEGYWNVLTAKSSPSTNTWYDVVCTFHGPTRELKVYLDGTLVSSTTAPGTTGSENTGINIAKRWDDPDYLDGTIKDINIWDGVLTPSEVAAQHTPYNSLV